MPTRIFASHTLRSSVDPTIARAFSSACELIASETGITVEYVEHVFTDDAGPAWVTIATAELAESLGSYRPRWSEADASLAAMLEHGAGVSLNDYIGALRQRYVETARLETLLGHGAVLLTPTTNVTAWPAQGPLPQRDKLGDAINTVEMNLTGAPAISLPLGTDEVGTPFGLQVIAPRCRDDLALGFAKRWEAMAGWPVVAPGFTPFTLATVLTSSS